jgi:vacuolar-type H+-ATPase subunit E/Vma4
MTSPGTDPSDRLSGTGTNQARSGTEATQEKAEHLTDRAREKAGELKRQAEEAAHGMRDRARSIADQQKHAAAGRVEGVAHALRRASDDLREQGQPMIAEYSRYAAEGLESMAQSLDRRDVDDFVEGVENFARERPVAFLGGAMVAGFALARFMKSSSARRYRRTAAHRDMGAVRTATGAQADRTVPGTRGTTGAGTWPSGSAERDAGTIGTPGAERDAGTIGTPGAGGYGRSGPGGL